MFSTDGSFTSASAAPHCGDDGRCTAKVTMTHCKDDKWCKDDDETYTLKKKETTVASLTVNGDDVHRRRALAVAELQKPHCHATYCFSVWWTTLFQDPFHFRAVVKWILLRAARLCLHRSLLFGHAPSELGLRSSSNVDPQAFFFLFSLSLSLFQRHVGANRTARWIFACTCKAAQLGGDHVFVGTQSAVDG